ncbi:MAG TPA: hypothetical protein VM686_18830, partial [Polyangiaceae bacterium]|nr:hypothetical protein [Polyangiaceae bacterium]
MRVRAFAWLFLVSVAAAGAIQGCNTEEGVTPDACVDPQGRALPLYDINAAGQRNDPVTQDIIQGYVDRG